MNPRSASPAQPWFRKKPRRQHVLIVLAAFLLVAAWLVRASRGAPATIWMTIYHPSDFPTVGSMVQYLLDLRIPIPPVITTLEILNYIVAGNTAVVTVWLYRIALVGSYLAAIYMAGGQVWRLGASFTMSVVFLWATTVIHPGNPQVYDVFYPCLLLLFVVALRFARSGVSGKAAYALCAAAGFFLAMAELTRPFVLLLLPVLLLCAWCALRSLPRRHLLWFLAPIVLTSGPWHVHQAVRHGQFTWSNNSGFNLHRAWPMVEQPQLMREPLGVPLERGRRPNLNTTAHGENSERLKKAVLSYIVTHPGRSAAYIVKRLASFSFDVKTSIYRRRPQHWVFAVYRPLVWVGSTWLLAGVVLFCVGLARRIRGAVGILGVPDNILILIAAMSIGIMAIGESHHEQARFLISVLPFLAALPVFEVPSRPASSRSETDNPPKM